MGRLRSSPPDAEKLLGRLDEAVHVLRRLPQLATSAHGLALWPSEPGRDFEARGSALASEAPGPEPGDAVALQDYRYAAAELVTAAQDLSVILGRRMPTPAEVQAACRLLFAAAGEVRDRIAVDLEKAELNDDVLEDPVSHDALRQAGAKVAGAVERAAKALRRATGEQGTQRPAPSAPAKRVRGHGG